MGDTHVDGKVLTKLVLQKRSVKSWTGFAWFRRCSRGLLWIFVFRNK